MFLSVFAVLCPVLKRLQCFWLCPIINTLVALRWRQILLWGVVILPFVGEHGAGLDSAGKHLFSVWQFLAAFMCNFLPCIKTGSDNLLKIHTSVSMSSHSVLVTDGPKLQNLDPELNILLLWYVRCKVLPSLRKKGKRKKKKRCVLILNELTKS